MQFKPGNNMNPSGNTAEANHARNQLKAALIQPEIMMVAVKAYANLLKAENALIVVDYFNRVAGKPKEQLELSIDPDAPAMALKPLTTEELQALARAQLALEAENKK